MFVEAILGEVNRRLEGKNFNNPIQPFQLGLVSKMIAAKAFVYDKQQPQLSKLIQYIGEIFRDNRKGLGHKLTMKELPHTINMLTIYDYEFSQL